MTSVVVGTAGWSLPSHHAAHFPGDGTHLARYARRLAAVEINSSFYRPHRRETYARWAAGVPETFRFAVKAPKAITHDARLIGVDDAIARFASEVAGLGTKLGVILVQLPPSLAFDRDAAGAVFEALHAAIGVPLACEPRHASWFTAAADADLAAWQVARVAADPPVAAGGGDPGGWRGLTYMRLHGAPRIYYSAYDDTRLAEIREQLAAARRPTWCIFDNTAAGAALGHALALT